MWSNKRLEQKRRDIDTERKTIIDFEHIKRRRGYQEQLVRMFF